MGDTNVLNCLKSSSLKRSRYHVESGTIVACRSEPGVVISNISKAQCIPYGRYLIPKCNDKPCEDHWVASAADAGCQRMQLYAVYDGHGGSDVASRFAATRLHDVVCEQLASSLRQQEGRSMSSSVDSFVRSALQSAFKQTDNELAALIDDQPLRQTYPGTTATVAVVTQQYIHLAWAGDSRAVVFGKGQVLAHTEEHRTSREDEQARLTSAGCHLFSRHGPPRVMGVLATTRAIGDHDLRAYGVVPTPEVLTIPRDPQQEFLILGSDGLWDYMKNEEVYNCAAEALQRVRDKHAAGGGHKTVCCPCYAAGVAARALAQRAKGRGSIDDITVLVVNVSTPCTCAERLGAHYTHNSSLLSKQVPVRIQRTGGLLGSCSADQSRAVAAGSLAGRPNKGAKLTGASLSADVAAHASAAEPGAGLRKPPWPVLQVGPEQQQDQQQLEQRQMSSSPLASPFSGGGLLSLQPSVSPYMSDRRPMDMPLRDVGCATLPSVSDLVMSSPFAGMLAETTPCEPLSGHELMACAEPEVYYEGLPAVLDSVGLLGKVESAVWPCPVAAFSAPLSADDPVVGSSGSSTPSSDVTRPAGSAPAGILDVWRGYDAGQPLRGALPLGVTMVARNRSCGLLIGTSA